MPLERLYKLTERGLLCKQTWVSGLLSLTQSLNLSSSTRFKRVLSEAFPTSEVAGLASQMRRSAFPYASNIVEGCSRKPEKDYRRFIEIAYGSACELQYQLKLTHDLALVKREALLPTQSLCIEVSRMLAPSIYLRDPLKSETLKPNA